MNGGNTARLVMELKAERNQMRIEREAFQRVVKDHKRERVVLFRFLWSILGVVALQLGAVIYFAGQTVQQVDSNARAVRALAELPERMSAVETTSTSNADTLRAIHRILLEESRHGTERR